MTHPARPGPPVAWRTSRARRCPSRPRPGPRRPRAVRGAAQGVGRDDRPQKDMPPSRSGADQARRDGLVTRAPGQRRSLARPDDEWGPRPSAQGEHSGRGRPRRRRRRRLPRRPWREPECDAGRRRETHAELPVDPRDLVTSSFGSPLPAWHAASVAGLGRPGRRTTGRPRPHSRARWPGRGGVRAGDRGSRSRAWRTRRPPRRPDQTLPGQSFPRPAASLRLAGHA